MSTSSSPTRRAGRAPSHRPGTGGARRPEPLGERRELGEHGANRSGIMSAPGYAGDRPTTVVAGESSAPVPVRWAPPRARRLRRVHRRPPLAVGPAATARLARRSHRRPPPRHRPRRRAVGRDSTTSRRSREAHGYRLIRSGALFPPAHESFAASGYETIDTLLLLELDLVRAAPSRRVSTAAPRSRARTAAVPVAPSRRCRGGPRRLRRAVGQRRANLTDIRNATPHHRARRRDVDGTLQAFAITGAAGRTGYLQRLAVHPDHQRSGLGSALVTDSLRWMRRRSLATAMVNTGVDNHPAQQLYDRFGFRPLPERLTIVELAVPPRRDPS